MARLSPDEFERKAGAAEGAWWLLTGPEEFKKRAAAQAALKRLMTDAGPGAAPQELEGEGLRAARVIASAQTPALFGGACVTVVRGVQRMDGDEQEALAQSLERTAPGAVVLLMTTEGGQETERAKGVASALLKAVEKAGTVVEFKRLNKDQAAAWVVSEAKRLGPEIEPAAAKYLVGMVGEDLLELGKEIEKLSLFAAGEKRITREHIQAVVPRRLEDAVFDMADAAAEGRAGRALQLLDDILAGSQRSRQGFAVLGVIGALAGHMRSLWDAKRLMEAGWQPGETLTDEWKALLAQPRAYWISARGDWKAAKVAGQARRFTWTQLAGALDVLAGADALAKDGPAGSERLAIERLMIALSRAPKAPRAGDSRGPAREA